MRHWRLVSIRTELPLGIACVDAEIHGFKQILVDIFMIFNI